MTLLDRPKRRLNGHLGARDRQRSELLTIQVGPETWVISSLATSTLPRIHRLPVSLEGIEKELCTQSNPWKPEEHYPHLMLFVSDQLTDCPKACKQEAPYRDAYSLNLGCVLSTPPE